MANPIIGRPDAFTRGTPQFQQPYPQQNYGQPGPYAQPGYVQQPPVGSRAVMTLDDVIAKTAISLGMVAAVAIATFMLLPLELLSPALIGSGIAGFITVLFVSTRQQVPVAGVLFYALVEGVFVGAFSKFFESFYPGIVVSAVLATFVTAAITLAAYKFFNIQVTQKMRRNIMLATLSLAGVLLVNWVLSIFGVNLGLRDGGWLAIGVSAVAIVLAVLNLVVDFDSVERGIAQQAPAQESWRAALGITVTMVWLYLEILRLLSYFRD